MREAQGRNAGEALAATAAARMGRTSPPGVIRSAGAAPPGGHQAEGGRPPAWPGHGC
jgi:hypothetical protein